MVRMSVPSRSKKATLTRAGSATVMGGGAAAEEEEVGRGEVAAGVLLDPEAVGGASTSSMEDAATGVRATRWARCE